VCSDEYGAVTSLPKLFETLVLESIQLVKEAVLAIDNREDDILDQPASRTNTQLLLQKVSRLRTVTASILDPDPHGSASFWLPGSASASNKNPDLDPHPDEIKIRIRIRIRTGIKVISWIRNRMHQFAKIYGYEPI
jgi:hypothetical protein